MDISEKSTRSTIKSPSFRESAAVWIATGFGTGRLPGSPGTFGSLLALPAAWALARCESSLGIWGVVVQFIVLVGIAAVGVPIINAALRTLGRGKDPGCVVWDEVSGQMLTFALVPQVGSSVLVAGFLLFRLFDITKPPPVRQLERLPGGLGVMADDWAAGLIACGVLHLLLRLRPEWFA